MAANRGSKEVFVQPDFSRCQCEWKGGSFMTLGPRQIERCPNQPTCIATEAKGDAHGQRGSMSLCSEHRGVLEQKQPGRTTFQEIVRRADGSVVSPDAGELRRWSEGEG